MSFLVTHDGPMEFEALRHSKAIDVCASKVSEPLEFYAARRGEPLSFRCSLVCSVNSRFYLRVSPRVVWLNEDNNYQAVINVTANVKWIIE